MAPEGCSTDDIWEELVVVGFVEVHEAVFVGGRGVDVLDGFESLEVTWEARTDQKVEVETIESLAHVFDWVQVIEVFETFRVAFLSSFRVKLKVSLNSKVFINNSLSFTILTRIDKFKNAGVSLLPL